MKRIIIEKTDLIFEKNGVLTDSIILNDKNDTDSINSRISICNISNLEAHTFLGKVGWKFYNRSSILINYLYERCFQENKQINEDFNAGIYVGTAFSNKNTISIYDYESRINGPTAVKVKQTPTILSNFSAGALAGRSKYRGANYTITAGALSGAFALKAAFNQLLSGHVNKSLVGAVEELSELDKKILLNSNYPTANPYYEASSISLLTTSEINDFKGVSIHNIRIHNIENFNRKFNQILKDHSIKIDDFKNIILTKNTNDFLLENPIIPFNKNKNVLISSFELFSSNEISILKFLKDSSLEDGFYLLLTCDFKEQISFIIAEKKN